MLAIRIATIRNEYQKLIEESASTFIEKDFDRNIYFIKIHDFILSNFNAADLHSQK